MSLVEVNEFQLIPGQLIHDVNQLKFDYVTETEFNSKFASIIDNELILISVFHLKIISLNSKHIKLCQFLQLLSIHFEVMVLTKIWSSYIDSYCNILPNYSFHYVLPVKGTVDGVGIFVNNDFSCIENTRYSINHTDFTRSYLFIYLFNN